MICRVLMRRREDTTRTMGLTDDVRTFLAEPRFAVLATAKPDGKIQQTVMWYELRDNTIMMNTVAGRVKHRNIHRDPRVSMCIEDSYRFVTIEGRVQETNDDPEIAVGDIIRLSKRYHPDHTQAQHDQFKGQARETLLISIDNVITNGF